QARQLDRKAPGNGLSRFDGLRGNLETGRPTIDCGPNDACRPDASTIHGNGSCVQEAASWNSTKRFSKRRPKIQLTWLDCSNKPSMPRLLCVRACGRA